MSARMEGAAVGGRDRTLSAVALGFVGMAMFAGTLPATRIALTELDADFIAVGRAVLAGLLAAVLLVATRQPLPARADLPVLAVIALCLVFGFPLFTGLAMVHVPANHGSVVLAILPLATATAATLVGGERPGLLFWLLAVAGGALVLIFALSDAGWTLIAGDAYLLAAAASAALGYALSGRLARRLPGWTVIAWALVLTLPVTVAASLVTAPENFALSASAWAAFGYLGAFSMFMGFVFWNAAMAAGGIAKIAQLQLLQPFLTMGMATAVGGEPLEPKLFAFATMVVLIVAAAQRLTVKRVTSATAAAPPSGP